MSHDAHHVPFKTECCGNKTKEEGTDVCLFALDKIVYYESIKRELKMKPMYESRLDILQT